MNPRQRRAQSQVRLLDEWFETNASATPASASPALDQGHGMTLVAWKVQGRQSGQQYLVQVVPGEDDPPTAAAPTLAWQCSCPDFTQRRVACKHIFFIKDIRLRGSGVLTWSTLWARLHQPPTDEDRSKLL